MLLPDLPAFGETSPAVVIRSSGAFRKTGVEFGGVVDAVVLIKAFLIFIHFFPHQSWTLCGRSGFGVFFLNGGEHIPIHVGFLG